MYNLDKIITENLNRFLMREYLDKEYMKPLYNYLKNGEKYSSTGYYNSSSRMVVPFFDYALKHMSDEDFKTLSISVKNNDKLQNKLRVGYTSFGGERRRYIETYSFLKDKLEKVDRNQFLKSNQGALYRILNYDSDFINLWDKFIFFCNSKEGKDMLKRGKYLEGDTVLMNPTLLKPQWLIHFTENESNALDILKNGFKKGLSVNQMSKIGYTKDNVTEKNGKYGYAYNAQEITDNFFPTDFSIPQKDHKYSNNFDQKVWENAFHYAIMFVAPGIEARHDTDNQQQVIFNTDQARNRVLLVFNWDKDFQPHEKDTRAEIDGQKTPINWQVLSNNGRVLYRNASITKVVAWVMSNYNQYKKKI